MLPSCPACGALIKDTVLEAMPDSIVCPKCAVQARLDELLWLPEQMASVAEYIPPGTSFESGKEGWTLVASTRNGDGCVVVPFTCVWTVLGLLSAFTDFTGMSIFLAITFFLVALSLLLVVGTIRITVTGTTGKVFTGIGPIGWTRQFDWSAVDYARMERGARNRWISLVGTRLTFGSLLNDERASYIVSVIRRQAQQRRIK